MTLFFLNLALIDPFRLVRFSFFFSFFFSSPWQVPQSLPPRIANYEVMAIFSVLFLVFSYWQSRGLETTAILIAAPAQDFCKSLLQTPSSHLVFYQAIACGTSLRDDTYEILKTVSLWHLVIVSAGHFQVILWFLRRFLPKYRFFHHLVLLSFCFWTGAQPPIVRAYADLLLRGASKFLRLSIPSSYSALYSSALVLILFPPWVTSWSFILSYLCALLILLLDQQPPWIQALGIALGIYPVIALFTQPHPLSFLFNLIFGPPLSMVLFPLSLLMMAVPPLSHLADVFLDCLLWLLTQLGENPFQDASFQNGSLQGRKGTPSYQITLSWVYIFILHLWVLRRQRRSQRKQKCKPEPRSQ